MFPHSRYTPRQRFLSAAVEDQLVAMLSRVGGICLLVLVAVLWVSLLSWSASDPSLTNATDGTPQNILGTFGAVVSDLLLQTLGFATVFVLIAPMFWGGELLLQGHVQKFRSKAACYPISVLVLAGAASSVPVLLTWPLHHGFGGILGDAVYNVIASLLALLLPFYADLLTGLVLFAIGAATMIYALGVEWNDLLQALQRSARDEGHQTAHTQSNPTSANVDAAAPMPWGRGAIPQPVPQQQPMPPEPGPRLQANMPPPMPVRRHEASMVHAQPAGGGLYPQHGQPPQQPPPFALSGAPQAQMQPNVPPAPAAYGQPVRHANSAVVPSLGAVVPQNTDNDLDAETLAMSKSIAARFAPSREETEKTSGQDTNAAGTGSKTPALLSGLKFHRKEQEPTFKGPSLNLLKRPAASNASAQTKAALRGSARLLEDVLSDFGVKGEIKDIKPGPVVTLYEFEPARGIKSSRVIGLADDIARSMSATSARVAVVPGRNAIGIELPNAVRETVLLRGLLESEAYKTAEGALPITLGKSISGDPVVADLARMPHLLVAGTTGSGKSVGVNAMILSLLYRQPPERCRMLMIDPKMLELSVYNDIPHLLCPVVTDPHKAVAALNWVVGEMEERYKRMSQMSVRNIEVYNNRVRNAKKRDERIMRTVQTGFDPQTGQPIYETEQTVHEPMPYIVVVVDEFADLMAVAGKDIEGAVQRLAQMARAAGIHLIMATQRPSVDIITGTIKANFPTRISFRVTSKIDSRTILNEQGAEHLLGQGDMLYAAGTGHTTRVHGPFVSDEEVESVAEALRAQGAPDYVTGVTDAPVSNSHSQGSARNNSGDDLYDKAVALVVQDQKASTSYVQRRLSIGYNRAADLIERMEAEGVIGPAGRGGKREILAPGGPTTGDDL